MLTVRTRYGKKSKYEYIAIIAHEMNRTIQDYHYEEAPFWNELDLETQEKYLDAVIDFERSPTQSPQEQHKRWVESKIRDGWKYGDKKDNILKTHPCICDWENLSLIQQIKDCLHISTVQTLLKPLNDYEKYLDEWDKHCITLPEREKNREEQCTAKEEM